MEAEVVVTPHVPTLASVGFVRLSQTEILRIDSARDAVPQIISHGKTGRTRFSPPVQEDHIFVENTELAGDMAHKFPVRFRLPTPAPPTVKGKYAHIRWQLSASILSKSDWVPHQTGLLANLTAGKVGEISQELVVFAHPDAEYIGGERLPDRPASERTYRSVSLQLTLDSGLAVNGGAIHGNLSVAAARAVKAHELRVELARWERSGNKQARVVESRQALQRPAILEAGEKTDWAFHLPVPDRLMPSMLGRHTFVGWQVRAVIERKLRPDFSVSQLVQIYTSP